MGVMAVEVGPPTSPYRGLRGVDAWGSGGFGASRDGGLRRHLGCDFLAQPGDIALAPIGGRVVVVGTAYPGSSLGSIHIQGDGPYAEYYVKILYVDPDVYVGTTVKAGDRIGQVQNVTAYYAAKSPGKGPMPNHVHLELKAWVNPVAYLAQDVAPET
jgi:hypothetical protein